MSFNSTSNAYSGSHKVWDHVGNIIPNVEHSEGVRPAFEFKPAAWLPVQFYDKYYENWFTIMPGKLVALDPDGRLMPAEYGLTSASVVYTQSDVDAGVIDIATGSAVTAAKTVVLSQLTGARGSGWTAALAGTTGGAYTSGFMGKFGVAFGDNTIKYPVGFAPYPYLQWAGDGSALDDGFNPAAYRQHNYNMQHQVAINCDYVIRLPFIPGQVASESVNKTTSGNLVLGTVGTHTRAQVQTNARYNATTGTVPVANDATVIAIALDNYPLAKNTAATTITMQSTVTSDTASVVLSNERTSVSAVQGVGDFFVDLPAGVVFLYSADGATVPSGLSGASGTVSVTYYHQATAPGVLSKFGCVLASSTELVPGDFLGCGTGSNWVRINPASATPASHMGQVLGFETWPRDGLDKVRTAFNPAINTDSSGSMANGVAGTSSVNLGQLDQMPGSATGGRTDLLSYAGGADRVVIINVIGR